MTSASPPSDPAAYGIPPTSGAEPLRADLPTIVSLATRLRSAAAAPCPPRRAASALAAVCELWRDHGFAPRRTTLARIAESWGFSVELLSESLDAVLLPFTASALDSLAGRALPTAELVGFVMAGNVAGAGIHEFVQAFIAGAALTVKSASSEPFFFAGFARTIAEIDPVVGARVAVLNWSREQERLTREFAARCDCVVAFGEDQTIAALSYGPKLFGFGSRLSGALVGREASSGHAADALAAAVARDVTLFEQRGCLSPHHVFVQEAASGEAARRFSGRLAAALARIAGRLVPPRRLDLGTAGAIRRAREAARWRKIGGEPVELWEGGGLSWSVIYDPAAPFRISPQYRTVCVTPIADLRDLEDRLRPVAGRLEAFAIADPAGRLDAARERLGEMGVSFMPEPGAMQSPPVDWRHGDGAFFGRLYGTR